MRKKLLVAAAFAASTLVGSSALASTARADYDQACLLHSGCFFSGTQWICPNPQIFALCREP